MEIYIKLNKKFDFNKFVSKLPEINIFSDIYVFLNNFKYFELLFNLLKELIKFLNTYPFLYLRLHIIHPYKENLESFYLKIYQLVSPFYLEGYNHQILPRLMVFPIFLFTLPRNLKDFLETYFFPPGIILDKKTQNHTLERVFINSHKDPLLSIGYQNILLNLLENIQSSKMNWKVCNPMMIFEEEKIFPCIYAYERKLSYIHEELCNRCLYRLLKKFSPLGLIDPQELATLHFRLALDLFENKNIEMALKHFYETLRFTSSDEKEEIYYYLGIGKAQLGDYASAIKYLKKAKIDHNTYFYLGFSFFQKNNFLKAKENLEKALNFNLPLEEKIPIVIYLGHTYKNLGLYEKAINLCEEIAKYVELEQIFNLMGTCYFKLGAYDKAVECFKKAILIDPFCAIDYANLCLSLKELNKREEAIYYGEKALELDPELDFIKKILREIKND